MASIKLKGDTSGEVTISAPAVAGTTTLELPATSSTLATQNALGVRNLIINGDMRIAQRGTSLTGQTTSGYKTCDRYNVVNVSAGTWTITQSTDAPTGFANSLKMQCTTANASLTGTNQIGIDTRLEAQNLQHLKYGTSSAEKITLSYWVKSNKTGIHTVEIYQQDDHKGISKEITINSADTWEKKTWTIPADTVGVIDNNNGIGLLVKWWLGVGSDFSSGTLATSWASTVNANRVSSSNINLADSTSNYINITGIQLEVGTEATPFEHRPYDMELARCKRYYTKVSGTVFHANIYHGYEFSSPMRATPSMTLSVGSTAGIANTGWRGIHTATSALTYYADAEL